MARQKWNGAKAKASFRRAAAEQLQAAAVFLQTQHKLRLNVSNPPPHLNSAKPGEYPRKRTGFGQANILRVPTNVAQTMAGMSVKVGIGRNAAYMLHLDLRGWKGLLDTLQDIRPQLEAIVKGTGGINVRN